MNGTLEAIRFGAGASLRVFGLSTYDEVLAFVILSNCPRADRLANQRLAALSWDPAFAHVALFSRARLWHKIGDSRGSGSR